MGIAYTTQVLHHSTLSHGQRMILMVIADHHGETGAWCSVATIAEQSGCCIRTVQRAIAAAEAVGELRRDINAGGPSGIRRDRRPNLYHITIDCPESCAGGPAHRKRPQTTPPRGDSTVTPPPVDNSSRGDTCVTASEPRGDKYDAHGVTQVSPKPSVEPSEELPSVSLETTDRATTGPTDGPGPAIEDQTAGGADAPAADPRLSDPGFLRFLAAVAPTVRRPERFTWQPGELDALEARWRSSNPFAAHHQAPTPQPPRFDRALHGPPPDAVPMPDHIRQALRRPA